MRCDEGGRRPEAAAIGSHAALVAVCDTAEQLSRLGAARTPSVTVDVLRGVARHLWTGRLVAQECSVGRPHPWSQPAHQRCWGSSARRTVALSFTDDLGSGGEQLAWLGVGGGTRSAVIARSVLRRRRLASESPPSRASMMRASSRRPRPNAGFVRQYEIPHLDSRLRTGLREVSGREARRRCIGVGGHLRDLARLATRLAHWGGHVVRCRFATVDDVIGTARLSREYGGRRHLLGARRIAAGVERRGAGVRRRLPHPGSPVTRELAQTMRPTPYTLVAGLSPRHGVGQAGVGKVLLRP